MDCRRINFYRAAERSIFVPRGFAHNFDYSWFRGASLAALHYSNSVLARAANEMYVHRQRKIERKLEWKHFDYSASFN